MGLRHAVVPGGDVGIEDERVPREAAARAKRRRDALEEPAPVSPGGEVEERAERAVDERRGLLQLELPHVALAELDVDARPRRPARGPSSSIAGDESIPRTRFPVSRATGIATRPLPTPSSTIGPSASRASST